MLNDFQPFGKEGGSTRTVRLVTTDYLLDSSTRKIWSALTS